MGVRVDTTLVLQAGRLGSIPSSSTICGSSSVVERFVANEKVVSPILICRSILPCGPRLRSYSSVVERPAHNR